MRPIFSSLLLFKVSSLLRFPRVFRYAAYACVAVFVAVALAMGVVSQLLPVVERHPQQVADWLSVRAGQPVRFDTIEYILDAARSIAAFAGGTYRSAG